MKFKFYIFTILLFISFFIMQIFMYLYDQNINVKKVESYNNTSIKEYRNASFELLIPKLLIYKVYKYEKDIEYAKLGYTPIWHPLINFKESTHFIHYIEPQNNIKRNDHEYYKFLVNDDLGLEVETFEIKEKSSKEIVRNKLFNLLNNLKTKKQNTILHLNLSEIEDVFIDKLLTEYIDIITGIDIIIEYNNHEQLNRSINLLEKINKNFILVSRSSAFESLNKLAIETKYYKGNIYDSTLFLSYINKNRVTKYRISLQQNTEKFYKGKKVKYFRPSVNISQSDIHWSVVITEYIKQLIQK